MDWATRVSLAAQVMTAFKVNKLSGSANWRSWELAIDEVARVCGWKDTLEHENDCWDPQYPCVPCQAVYPMLRSTCTVEVKEHIAGVTCAKKAYAILHNTFGPASVEGKRYALEQARIEGLATIAQ
ncbi:hypothetical protein JCM3775_001889 [Rhodotorula graminis]